MATGDGIVVRVAVDDGDTCTGNGVVVGANMGVLVAVGGMAIAVDVLSGSRTVGEDVLVDVGDGGGEDVLVGVGEGIADGGAEVLVGAT